MWAPWSAVAGGEGLVVAVDDDHRDRRARRPAGGPAERIAEEVLATARDRGLDGNATVAVAHMAPSSGRSNR